MGYDRWRAGEITTASKLNSMIPQYILQVSDITRTSSTTFVDTDITWTPDASATYYYEMLISYGASQSSDFRWRWQGAQISTWKRFVAHTLPQSSDDPGFTIGNNLVTRYPAYTSSCIAGGNNIAGTITPTSFVSAWDRGVFTTTATPAAVMLQIAQGTSSTNQTIFRGGNNSRIVYQRIA